MISSSTNVQRYYGSPVRLRIGFHSEPAIGNHAMLAVNVQGIDLNVHMNVEDLRALHAAAGEVLAQLDAIEEAKFVGVEEAA